MGAFRRVIYRREVIVNLSDDKAFRGVLFKQDGPLLVLKNALYMEGRNEPLPMDGDIVIERDRVLFIQAL